MGAFADPKHIMSQLGLREGMHVGDFGSGSGVYTVATAELVGTEGRVYAIDIQKELLRKVKDLSRGAQRGNIEVLWGDLEEPGGSKLHDRALDVAVLANTLFQVEHKDVLLKEIARVLKPGGALLLIDWTDSHGGMGPMPDAVVTEAHARELLGAAGFVVVRTLNAGSHHYGLIAQRP